MKHIVEGIDKGTIVFIHGNSSSSDVYNSVMESPLIKQTKVSIELAGHGRHINHSSKVADFSIKSYCNQLTKEISEIEGDILLVGNSLGGHLAIEISKKVSNLKGLLIFGTPPLKKPINFEEAFIPVPELHTFLSENPSEDEIKSAAQLAVVDEVYVDQIVKDFKNSNPLVRKSLFIDLTENNWSDQLELFVNLHVPKYIIAGTKDPSVNKNYLEAVKNMCGETCSIIEFKECGHYPSLEKPKEFIETLKSISKQVFMS